MTDLLEHLAVNIKKIISEEDKSSSVENFENTMVDVKTFLTQMGLNEFIINNFEVKITKIFDDLIKDGISFKEAFEKYAISESKMLRYASRRRKKQELEIYLNDISKYRQQPNFIANK